MDICRRRFGYLTLAGLASGRAFALPQRPKLLVLVVLEQFRADALASLWPQLSAGGFRKILEKAACFPDCRHLASTFPSAVTATLACGAWPAQHGIVADTWYDRTAKSPVSPSEEDLLAGTVTAEIAGAPRTRAYVVGMEGARTRMFAGTSAAQIYWMDDNGHFVTRDESPDWLDTFNSSKGPENLHDSSWLLLPPRGGAVTIETSPALRVLKYDGAHPREFMALYKSSPFAQAAQFDFLRELIAQEHLGQRDTFDFVCLLEGAANRLGYETGAKSLLMDQLTLNLDRSLESLLALCNRTPGDGNFNLVLAGGHGAPAEPPEESRERMAVNGETIADAIDHALRANGLGSVQKYVYPFLYLDTSGFREPEELRAAAARASLQLPAVAGYFTAGGACSVTDVWQRRFQNSFHPKRAGDVMLSYRPGYVEDTGKARGVSYGSLYNYDVSVPLYLYGPQFRAGSYEKPVESVDVAPTLARISGVAAPSACTGRVLSEALAE